MVKDNYKKYQQLRAEHNFFIYEGFKIDDSKEKLTVTFMFNLADQYRFNPTIEFKKGNFFTHKLEVSEMENFIFHIGLVELISYWKAACPPLIIIKPFRLNDEQIAWWKNLWVHGLGEFFYLNNIQPSPDDFVRVTCESEKSFNPSELTLERDKILIPVGGGRDSAVTLEILKSHFNCIPFSVNPRKASLETVRAAGFENDAFIEIKRTIHPQLLRLNELGFLNGHTPFSALLAFVSVFAAAMNGVRSVALSNESSANEPTDSDTGVNHQYSKSFEFEHDFRNYIENYISKDINYFSFLRPLNEYSIAGLFARYSNYFKVFRSCNVGSKTDSWCGKCPKCLFTFIILSPHLSMKKVVEIFGKDMLDDKNLKGTFDELAGISELKPFECVGTKDEVNYSLVRTIEKRGEILPYLLKYYISTPYYYRYRDYPKEEITQIEKKAHFLEDGFMRILRKALHGL